MAARWPVIVVVAFVILGIPAAAVPPQAQEACHEPGCHQGPSYGFLETEDGASESPELPVLQAPDVSQFFPEFDDFARMWAMSPNGSTYATARSIANGTEQFAVEAGPAESSPSKHLSVVETPPPGVDCCHNFKFSGALSVFARWRIQHEVPGLVSPIAEETSARWSVGSSDSASTFSTGAYWTNCKGKPRNRGQKLRLFIAGVVGYDEDGNPTGQFVDGFWEMLDFVDAQEIVIGNGKFVAQGGQPQGGGPPVFVDPVNGQFDKEVRKIAAGRFGRGASGYIVAANVRCTSRAPRGDRVGDQRNGTTCSVGNSVDEFELVDKAEPIVVLCPWEQ